MKRSPLTRGLLGLLLAAGLVVAPTAAATPTGSCTDPSATPTATDSATATQAPPSMIDDTVGPQDPATPGDNAPAVPTPEDTQDDPVPETPESSPASTESPSAAITGDAGMTFKNTQYSDEASIVSVHRNGCLLTFEIAITVSGTYTIQVWDDGEMIGTVSVTGDAGTTQTGTYLMGANVGTQATGYDFVLVTEAGDAVQVVTWDFEGSENVMAQCAAAATITPTVLPAVATAAPTPQLAKTGVAAGALAVGALVLAGAGLALRRVRRRS